MIMRPLVTLRLLIVRVGFYPVGKLTGSEGHGTLGLITLRSGLHPPRSILALRSVARCGTSLAITGAARFGSLFSLSDLSLSIGALAPSKPQARLRVDP